MHLGWIRKRKGGALETHFEGAPDDVEYMIAGFRDELLLARVEPVNVPAIATDGCNRFDLRRTV